MNQADLVISHNVTLAQQNTEQELLRPAFVYGISSFYNMIIFPTSFAQTLLWMSKDIWIMNLGAIYSYERKY